jgi:hypothetical protein
VEIKFCENEDGRIAVGTGIRPIRWCRACYVKECGPEFQAWKVIVQADDVDGIACAKTGETISRGGTAWLDPAETNIAALVYGAFIEAFPAEKPAAKAAKTEA